MDLLEDYKKSDFYKKYNVEEPYFSDSILKKVFNVKMRRHNISGIGKKDYNDIYEINIKVMEDFLKLYYEQSKNRDNSLVWKMLKSFYIDPDRVIKKNGDIICTADGILSLRRLFEFDRMSKKLIEDYKKYREKPIIYFPKEKNGINSMRALIFGDRIDYTLFDLKKYYTDYENCKMKYAYELKKTSSWLKQIGSFENLIDEFHIKGIFTNDNYEVYDLEKNDGSIIEEYLNKYEWKWSTNYFKNVKQKINEFMENN